MSDAREKLIEIIVYEVVGRTATTGARLAADAILSAMPDIVRGMIKPLVWDVDGRRVRFDDTMVMGKGYDWDGWEIMREEAYSHGFAYAIWPDCIGSYQYNLYCDLDGTYIQNLSEQAAKAAANAHNAAQVLTSLGIT